MNPDQATIALMGKNVPASHELLPIEDLLFFPDNPRVYAVIREMADFESLTSEERQERIYQQLLKEPSVKNLLPEVKHDEGLQEPVIVRWDTKVVIEGNSRLAVYRKMHEEYPDDERWLRIQCLVVHSLTLDEQIRLLGQTHLRGKTDWSPFAKALSCYRLVVEEEQMSKAELSRLYGISVGTINKNIKIIQLMEENEENRQSRFSYYKVLAGDQISSAIEQHATLRAHLMTEVKANAFTALDLRKRLPDIVKKPKIRRKFEKGEITLEEAYDRAKISGMEQSLKNVNVSLDDIGKGDVASLNRNELRSAEQTVRKIRRNVARVSAMIEAEVGLKSKAKG